MQHLVKLRYYPGDPLKVILEKDIQALAARWSLKFGENKSDRCNS